MVSAQTAAHEPAPAVPLRPLAVLVAAVLAIHLLLLQATPGAFNLEPPAPVRKFITRTVEINRPAPDAATPEAGPAPGVPAVPAVPAARKLPATTRLPADTPVSPTAPAVVEAAPAPVTAPAPAAAPAEPPAPPAPAPPAARLEEGPRPVAFSIPGSIKLNYNVTGEAKRQAWNARSELVWRHDGTAYDARMEVSAFLVGARTQTSAGRITAEGLAPTRFSDKSRQEVAAHFDRERGRVVFSANTPEATLLAGAQDRLSVFLQLGAMIAGEPSKYPQGAAISIQTVGPREAESWVFTVDGEEKLNLPGGELRALKLTRSPRRDFDLKAEVWLAPAMGYLPARLRLTQQNGDFVDQQLRSTDRP